MIVINIQMNSRTKGAWIIHHANKLKQIEEHDYEEIDLAGKAGKLLSGLAASDEESTLNGEKVHAIAKAAGINKAELPTLLDKLKDEELIDHVSAGGVAVLGVVTSSVLSHTANIFKKLNPSTIQRASLSLAESVSSQPVPEKEIREFISDTYKLSKDESTSVIEQSEDIGFVDSETIDGNKMLFNGNLFKSDAIQKAKKILETLSSDERRALNDINTEIEKYGVIPFDKAQKIGGTTLLEKLQSIGMYEFSKVSNNIETKLFITKPEAFSKFGNPFEEDALDLAKAFVASLSYGINYSSAKRGKIELLFYLIRKLLRGETVGPAPAIGHDYKYLELKRVVQIIPKGNGYYSMRLLKKEVGELALQVMQQGDTTESTLLTNSSNISSYDGPEKTRRETRKKRQTKKSDIEVQKLLRTLRG